MKPIKKYIYKNITSIRVSKDTNEELKKLKLVPSETMDGCINRIIKSYKQIDKREVV